MDNLPFFQKSLYTYLSRMYLLTYASQRRSFLGITLVNWAKYLPLVLLLVGWMRHWPWWALVLLAFLAVWIHGSYWAAKRAGYIRFLPDEAATLPAESAIPPLQIDEHISLRATGHFSVQDLESYLLLSPAQYWQVAMGDHIVMVEHEPGRFLYQFFGATNLLDVQPGWLLFGTQPKRSLAVTFHVHWGPGIVEQSVLYYIKEDAPPPKIPPRTIYLTVGSEEAEQQIWQAIVLSARAARQ